MHDFRFHREYRGQVKALVLDWSGTTADAYVIAPAVVFVEAFKNQGVTISMKEAREPMGLRKDLHIKALTEVPELRQRWHEVHGRYPDQSDVDRMFEDFVRVLSSESTSSAFARLRRKVSHTRQSG